MIRKNLYKFFDKFSLVDLILICMILTLGVFSWVKYDEEALLTEKIAIAKLKISSDFQKKSIQEWFRVKEKDFKEIIKDKVDKKLFTQDIKNRIYLIDNNILGFVDDKKIINLDKNYSSDLYFTGFHRENSNSNNIIGHLVMKIENKNVAGWIAMKLNADEIFHIFNAQNKYISYLINPKFMLINNITASDKKLNIKENIEKFKTNFIFNRNGLFNKPVLGYHEYLKIYNVDWAVINEVNKEYVFHSLYKRRENIIMVLSSLVFFSIFMFVRVVYKRNEKTKDLKTKFNNVKNKETKQVEILLWDREDFNKRFVEMEDMKETIIVLFIEDTSSQLAKLKAAIEEEDYKKIKSFAHTIKGASSNVSTLRVTRLSLELEYLINSDESIKKIDLKFKQLESAYYETSIILKKYLESFTDEEFRKLSKSEIVDALKKLQENLNNGSFISSDSLDIFKVQNDKVQELKKDIDSFKINDALVKVKSILDEYEGK